MELDVTTIYKQVKQCESFFFWFENLSSKQTELVL